MARPSGNGIAGPLPGLLGLLLGAVLSLALGQYRGPGLRANAPGIVGHFRGRGTEHRRHVRHIEHREEYGNPFDNRGFDFVVQFLPIVVKPPLHSGHPLSHIVTGSGLPNDTRLDP